MSSIRTVDEHGNIVYCNAAGQLHREDGPAIEYVDGDKRWYINGERHREGGPAIEYTNGDKRWYINGNLHRIDGPAVENVVDGIKEWYINGKLHCEDGPAVEDAEGKNPIWYVWGKRVSRKNFPKALEVWRNTPSVLIPARGCRPVTDGLIVHVEGKRYKLVAVD